jgi:hypothetical protein
MYLEAYKFGLYLLVPIGASLYFGNPQNQKRHAEYWSYVTYPANPNVGLREHIKEDLQWRQKQKEGREEYRKQLQELEKTAKRRSVDVDVDVGEGEAAAAAAASGVGPERRPRWWSLRRWWGGEW